MEVATRWYLTSALSTLLIMLYRWTPGKLEAPWPQIQGCCWSCRRLPGHGASHWSTHQKKSDFENEPCGVVFNAGVISGNRPPRKSCGGEGKLQSFIYTIFLHLISAGVEESKDEYSRSLPYTPTPITPGSLWTASPQALLKQNCVPMVTQKIFCWGLHVMWAARVTRLIC